ARHPLRLAGLTALGFVLELFVVEKQLFPSCEDKILPTVDALQTLILEFHIAPVHAIPCAEAAPGPNYPNILPRLGPFNTQKNECGEAIVQPPNHCKVKRAAF